MGYVQERLAQVSAEAMSKVRQREDMAQALRASEERRRAEQLNPPRVGVIYFIKSGALVKIGFTTALEQRMEKLRSGNPHEMKLLGSMPGTDDTEFFLHQMFAAYRATGEWFRIDGNLDSFLAALPRETKFRKRGKRLEQPSEVTL